MTIKDLIRDLFVLKTCSSAGLFSGKIYIMSDSINPWKTVSSNTIYESQWLTLYEDAVIKPNGDPGTYVYTLSPPFVLIVGYDGKRFTMVRQYRYALKRVMIEFAGGSIDDGEDPLGAAKREFKEETGLVANKWTKLGTLHNPNPATVFLAEELINTNENEMGEDGIESVEHVTRADIDTMIESGEFTDSKTMAALLLFERSRHTA